MDKSNLAIILAVIALVAVAIIIYFMYFRNQVQTTSYTQQSISPSPILPTTTIISTPTTTSPSMTTYYVTFVPNKQYVVSLPASPFVIVVSPTQQNQVFDAYVSMTPRVDDTAVQVVSTVVISETTVLVKSSDIQNYIGYPYLIVNSSAPFTIYVAMPPIITS